LKYLLTVHVNVLCLQHFSIIYSFCMKRVSFGSTGLQVSPLGFGAGQLGGTGMTESEVGTILNRALDRGINLVDTARGYGLAEERIGRHLSWRRQDFVLVSKCGYSVPGVEDWTPRAIHEGVDMALRLMQTDYIDVMLFHSCGAAVLRREGLIDALADCVSAGKVRFMGYSGENDDLAFAISTGRFSVIETSVNLFDQRGLSTMIADAATPNAASVHAPQGLAVIGKRPLANVAWQYAERPVGAYCEPYWERLQAMNSAGELTALLDKYALTLEECALRFAAYANGVSTAIVGTGKIENLERNIALASNGALPNKLVAALHELFEKHHAKHTAAGGSAWDGQI
jgi:aryl-alcohol dehydrogenase-like predicted oxidoreductase